MNKNNIHLGAMMAMLGAVGYPSAQIPSFPVAVGPSRPRKKVKQRKFGEPAGPPLNWDRIKPNPGDKASLRHDQIQRRVKTRKKANSKLFKPYHKRKAVQCESKGGNDSG